MKMNEAMEIINPTVKSGFRVSFEVIEGIFLKSDYFPDHNEPLIPTETEAWDLAVKFAANTKGKCVNIYVTKGDHTPVEGYTKRQIKNR